MKEQYDHNEDDIQLRRQEREVWDEFEQELEERELIRQYHEQMGVDLPSWS